MKPVYPQLNKPVLIYNECCDFCTDVAHWLLEWLGRDNISIVPNSEPWLLNLDHSLTFDKIQKNVHLIALETIVDGHRIYEFTMVYSAGEAVINVLALRKELKWLKSIYRVWPINHMIELIYYILKKNKKYYRKSV